MQNPMTRYVINVVVEDRVGIIADITEALYRLGGNLEALSQTVVWGWFTMILCGIFPEKVTAGQIKEGIEKNVGFHATVLPHTALRPGSVVVGDPFVVTVIGKDKPGIVTALTRCFAERGINIEDVWNEVQDGQFIVIFKLTVPKRVDPKELRYELDGLAEKLAVQVRLQHQDVFTATNSLSVHTRRQR